MRSLLGAVVCSFLFVVPAVAQDSSVEMARACVAANAGKFPNTSVALSDNLTSQAFGFLVLRTGIATDKRHVVCVFDKGTARTRLFFVGDVTKAASAYTDCADRRRKKLIADDSKSAAQCISEITGQAVMPEEPATATAEVAPGNGPSFDCSRAKSASARLICFDKELSALDAQLAIPFRQKLEGLSTEERDAVIGEQRRWINERNQKCGVPGSNNRPTQQLLVAKPCMVEAIKARISELESESSQVAEKSAAAGTPDRASVVRALESAGLIGRWGESCADASVRLEFYVEDGSAKRRLIFADGETQNDVLNVERIDGQTVRVKHALQNEPKVAATVTYLLTATTLRIMDFRNDTGRVAISGGRENGSGEQTTTYFRCNGAAVAVNSERVVPNVQADKALPVAKSEPSIDAGRGHNIRGLKLGMRAGHLPPEFNSLTVVASPAVKGAYQADICVPAEGFEPSANVKSCVYIFFQGNDPERRIVAVLLTSLRLGKFQDEQVAEQLLTEKYGTPNFLYRRGAITSLLWGSNTDLTKSGVVEVPGLMISNPDAVASYFPGFRSERDVLMAEIANPSPFNNFTSYATIALVDVPGTLRSRMLGSQSEQNRRQQELQSASRPRF